MDTDKTTTNTEEINTNSSIKDTKQGSKPLKKKTGLLLTLAIVVLLGVVGFIYRGASGNKIVQETSDCVKATGDTVKKTIDVSSFNGVVVGGPSSNLHVKQGGNNSFEIEAKQNIIDLLETSVDGEGILHIDYSQCINDSGLVSLFQRVNYYVSMEQISKLEMNGSGKIINEGETITSDDLSLVLSGSGNITLDIDVSLLATINSGSGTIVLTGKAADHKLVLSGSGKTKAYDLLTENTDATVSGSGHAQVHATKELASKVAGSGSIDYKGDPEVIK